MSWGARFKLAAMWQGLRAIMQADSRNFVLFVFFVAKNNFVAKIEKKRAAVVPKMSSYVFPERRRRAWMSFVVPRLFNYMLAGISDFLRGEATKLCQNAKAAIARADVSWASPS